MNLANSVLEGDRLSLARLLTQVENETTDGLIEGLCECENLIEGLVNIDFSLWDNLMLQKG